MDNGSLTLSEAAHRLRCSERTVRRLIAKGHLASIKLLGSRRVLPESLEKLMREGTPEPDEAAS